MRARATPSLFGFGTVLACLLAGPVLAQADAEPAQRRFEPAWFAASAPANAWDMVQRLPGFAPVDADPDVRGYAGALGNVLVDGVRPASKRDELSVLLRRIPAGSVQYIELVRAGDHGIDMAGHALLANIVRRTDPAPEMAVEFGLVIGTDGWTAPRGEFEYGRHRGERALELAASTTAEPDEDGGEGERLTTASDGEVLERATSDDRSIYRQHEGSLHWRQPWAGGRLNLHASALQETLDFDGRLSITEPTPAEETVEEYEDLRQAEFGARYSRLLEGSSTLTAMASQQLGWLEAQERSDDGEDQERFSEDTRLGESLAGIGLAWEQAPRLSLNASVEVAYNFIDSRTDLVENGAVVDLPGSRVRVEEQRVEGALLATWQPTDDWQIEGGLRLEASRLEQTGDSPMTRRFTYPKPQFGITYDVNEKQELRWSVAREVGQLDFGDFVASASLDSGDVSAGNANLEPDKTWRSELAWKHEFGEDGSVVLTWIHDRISDVVDRVPVQSADGELFDAPGNIGDGRRDGFEVEAGSSLDAFGWPSLRLSASVLWQHSRVRDPTTGRERGISEDKPVEGELSLVQTLPAQRLSWGLTLGLAERETSYRYDEIASEEEAAYWHLFAERRLGKEWRMRVELSDLGGRAIRERRQRYDDLRDDGPADETETRRHDAPGQLMLTLRRDIGA